MKAISIQIKEGLLKISMEGLRNEKYNSQRHVHQSPDQPENVQSKEIGKSLELGMDNTSKQHTQGPTAENERNQHRKSINAESKNFEV